MRKLWSPLALVVVALATLTVASGIFDAQPPSRATRVASLEATIKCPSCEGLSVAQSNAPSAVAVRQRIAREVRAGATNTEILDGLVATYGSTILLVPPTHGLTLVLWIWPVVVVLLAAVLVTVMLRRSRRGNR